MSLPRPLPTASGSTAFVSSATPFVTSVMADASNSPGLTQTQLKTCELCGRLFFDALSLQEHKQVAHEESPAMMSVHPENLASEPPVHSPQEVVGEETHHVLEEEVQHEEEEQDALKFGKLYWVKMRQIFWPCESIAESGELLKVRIFNDLSTEVAIDVSKLKEFGPVERIPRARTADWRRGYETALNRL